MDQQQNQYIQPEAEQPESQPIPEVQPVQEPIPKVQPVQEPTPVAQPVQQPVIGERPTQKPARPVSPFAGSPYVECYVQPQQPQKPKKAKKKKKTGKTVLAIVVALALILASSAVTALTLNAMWEEKTELLNASFNDRMTVLQNQIDQKQAAGNSTPVIKGDGLTPKQIYEQNVNAVVAVSCYAQQTGYFQSGTYESFGSGFIISQDGYIVSNYHVVEGATEIWITMHDGKEYSAELVGYEAGDDVALLKMEGNGFPCVQIGSSDVLAVGDLVVAIGNPLGELTSTLTVGYVSAKDRIVSTDGTTQNMFQTDAAINSGNSGGPLFNVYGEVVGITTAKYSGTSSSGASIEGIGFAIPMDDVIGILEDLRDFGYVTGAYLGVYVRDVSADGVRDGLPAGAYVEETVPGYCAAKAGIQSGDIIINVGGYDVGSVSELTRVLRKFEADQSVVVTVYRKGREVTLSVVLDPKPEEITEQPQQQTIPMPGDEGFEDWYREFFGDYFG